MPLRAHLDPAIRELPGFCWSAGIIDGATSSRERDTRAWTASRAKPLWNPIDDRNRGACALLRYTRIVLPQLLSDKRRDECQLETQRLFHCSTFAAPDSPLTDNQRQMCCEALHTFNEDNCFCGWGEAAAMNPWTRDVLGDLACALYSCGLKPIPCMEEENYLQDSVNPAAYYVGPEMQALQTASSAVSRMAKQEGWAPGQRLPEKLATTLQPLMDLRFISRLLPSGASLPGGSSMKGEPQSTEFDIKLEVEQEGGDAEELLDTVQQLADWLSDVLVGGKDVSESLRVHDSDQHGEIDPPVDAMDRSDSLALLLKNAINLISTVLNGTEAQVEVAVEITMETTTSVQRPEKTLISSSRPLISRVLLPDSADSSTSMLYKHRETELVASPTMEQRQRHGCKLKSLAQAARQNPARVFAILAGIAFVCLLGTFVAQVVLAIVCGVQHQLEAREEVVGIVVNPLLEPELTTPLLDVQGELRRGYSQC
ncbi:g11114 [Coccomyxa viridis]|uniref:G11114 protein n=1 Tax=Coccomyxa viridis TaxID=1274662 RepID=A0ABP1G7D2_9CHLO